MILAPFVSTGEPVRFLFVSMSIEGRSGFVSRSFPAWFPFVSRFAPYIWETRNEGSNFAASDFACAVQGRIDTGAHGRKLVGRAEEAERAAAESRSGRCTRASKLTLMAWTPRVGAPALGVALLLPVGLADIGGLFAGCGEICRDVVAWCPGSAEFLPCPAP